MKLKAVDPKKTLEGFFGDDNVKTMECVKDKRYLAMQGEGLANFSRKHPHYEFAANLPNVVAVVHDSLIPGNGGDYFGIGYDHSVHEVYIATNVERIMECLKKC